MILVAVALFAALSYAVTQSGRGGGNIDREQRALQAAQIVQYLQTVSQAVQRMRIINGCSDTQISFHDTNWGHNDYLHAPVLSSECRIYEDGGNVPFQRPDDIWLDTSQSAQTYFGDYVFYAGICVGDIGTGTVGPSCNTTGPSDEELVMILPWMRRDLCIEINNQLGIDNPGGDPPTENNNAYSLTNQSFLFNGDYADGNVVGSGPATEGNVFVGQPTACFEGGGEPAPGSYHLYHVLIER